MNQKSKNTNSRDSFQLQTHISWMLSVEDAINQPLSLVMLNQPLLVKAAKISSVNQLEEKLNSHKEALSKLRLEIFDHI